jgi:hypothetical protein
MVDAKMIRYRVEYLDAIAGSVPTNVLPDRMTLIFADKMAMNTLEGFLGQFSLTYLADLQKNTVVTMLKLFDKKYYYKGKAGELPAGILPLEGMFLEQTSESRKILDFDTKKYILHLPGQNKKELFATESLDIRNPNIATPYKELPEVLLQFYTELSVLKMVMVAESYEETSLKREYFSIPDNYSEISRSTMEKILTELFK